MSILSQQKILPEESLAAKYPNIAAEWDYDKNLKTPNEYAAVSGKKVFWKCRFGHTWEAQISTRTRNGTGCPYCSGRKAWPGETDLATLYPSLVYEWHPTKNGDVTPATIRPGCNTKYWWVCKNGHEWDDSPNHRVSGRGCPFCSHRRLLPKDSLAVKYPAIAAEWDYKANDKTPSDYSAFSNKKVSWICKTCGNHWLANIDSRTNMGSGCPVCSNQKIIPGVNDLVTINPFLASEWDYELNEISPSEVGAGSPQKVWWKCAFGHSWQASIKHRNNGTGCPECKKHTKTSIQEYTCYYYISSYFQDAIHSYKSEDLKQKELDIFIPSLNVGIEYDGAYWHRSVEKDVEKDNLCSSLGIILIRIREAGCKPYMRSAPTYTLADTSAVSLQEAIISVLKFLKIDSPSINVENDSQAIIEEYCNTAISSSFSSLYNELSMQWHPTLNGSLKPENIPGTSSTMKVFWLCPVCNSSWKASIDSRIRGSGCPVCAGRVVKEGYNDLQTCYPQIACQWHTSKNAPIMPTGVTSHSHEKVWWKCDLGHEWRSTVKDRVEGNNCPFCSGKKVLKGFNDLATVNPALAKEWAVALNDKTPFEVTAHSRYKAYWCCKKCGYIWPATIYNRSKGSGCPMCSPKRKGNHRK